MSEKVASNLTGVEQQEADDLFSFYTEKGISHEENIQRYSQTSDKYDKWLKGVKYSAPSEMAATIGNLFPSNRDEVYILDIAAGTGMCAVEFNKIGFRKMDALDACLEMLEKAKKKNLYGCYIHDMLGDNTLDIADDTYDVITVCGMSSIIVRELPLNALKEMIRVVKPGGFVVNIGMKTTFTDDNGLMRNTKVLETQEKKWKRVELRQYSGFILDHDGIVSVHEVC